jgi:hypothetical protein
MFSRLAAAALKASTASAGKARESWKLQGASTLTPPQLRKALEPATESPAERLKPRG